MAQTRATIGAAVDKLFADQPVPRDLALQLLNSWIANLQATETSISRNLFTIVGTLIAFLALDTGILSKLVFQGAELQRTGLVMCMAPVVIAYLYYRSMSQVSFAHDLRTAIAVLYKRLNEAVFYGGLDLLTHTPAVRNLESYDSLRAPRKMRTFHERTTDVVTVTLLLGPLTALVYCLVRLWHYPDVGPVLWSVTALLSLAFVCRTCLFGLKSERDDDFAFRRQGTPSNQPLQPPRTNPPPTADS